MRIKGRYTTRMLPQPRHAHIGAYLWLLAALVVMAGLFYFLRVPAYAPNQAAERGLPTQQLQTTLPTPTANDIVTAQQGFQHLVSYINTGFRPAKLTIKKGETIRFVNNSTDTVQISYADSVSQPLALGEYWEYAIPANDKTQFTYTANGSTGSVTIK